MLWFLFLYAVLYAAFGVQSPFLPALLKDRGLTSIEIAVVLAGSTAVRILAGPLAAYFADIVQQHSRVLQVCVAAAALTGAGYVSVHGFAALLSVGLLQSAWLAPVVPLSDALATTSALASRKTRTGNQRFRYGWVRGAGSAAFICGTLLSGWTIQHSGLSVIVWVSGALLVAGCFAAFGVPPIPPDAASHISVVPSLTSDIRVLLRTRAFRYLVAVAALVEGSHALHDGFAVIRWQAAAISPVTASILWSESVAAEVVVFLLIGSRLIIRFGPARACALSASAGILRWTVLGITTSPIALALVEPLHGLTFALLHLACLQLIVQIVPVRLAATAQSIYGTLCIGLATAAFTLMSGVLYGKIGGESFFIMAGFCVIAVPLCRGLRVERPSTSI